ncbi:MAG: hypothetical protein WBP45_03155 [Daejeonella sp.]
MYDKYKKFEPTSYVVRYKTGPWNEKKFLKLLGEDISNQISISNHETKDRIHLGTATATKVPFSTFTLTLDQEYLNLQELIPVILHKQGFVSACVFNERYVTQQTLTHESTYAVAGISLELAKGLPYRIDEFGMKEFDISQNWGSKEQCGYSWLVPAWKMWFGEPFYKLVSKERLLAFPYAVEIKVLENDMVYIQLFEKVEESATAENREKQRLFREWCDFDGLVKKYS